MEDQLYKKKEKDGAKIQRQASLVPSVSRTKRETANLKPHLSSFTPSTTNSQVSTAVTGEVGKAVGPAAEATAVTQAEQTTHLSLKPLYEERKETDVWFLCPP